MILYIEDLLREVNIKNWYLGEARKKADNDAVFVQSDVDAQDILLYHLRQAVVSVLQMANNNRVVFTCDYKDDALVFAISPIRQGREHLIGLLKESIRLFLVAEIRLLWMMNTKPEWADATMREGLIANIRQAMNDVTFGEKVRRRCAIMGI